MRKFGVSHVTSHINAFETNVNFRMRFACERLNLTCEKKSITCEKFPPADVGTYIPSKYVIICCESSCGYSGKRAGNIPTHNLKD